MADDWDTVTKIGSKARGGASQRETVVRGKSALNAAQRSGTIINTEKKMGAGNSASKPGVEGQFLAKLDRTDDIVPPKKPHTLLPGAISDGRKDMKPPLTQKELATKCNIALNDLKEFENGKAIPDNKQMTAMERVLKVHLRGPNIGKSTVKEQDAVPKKEVKKSSSK